MGERVAAQVAVAAEHFAAVWAIVRLNVRVSQEVSLQIAALIESSTASRTFMWGILREFGGEGERERGRGKGWEERRGEKKSIIFTGG